LKSFQNIKVFIGGFLVCVFALGITPKQVLHDILTNHQHVQVKEKNSASVSKDRYQCDEENFVAESPFVDTNNSIQISMPEIFQASTNLFFTTYCFLHQFFFELRGPPCLA